MTRLNKTSLPLTTPDLVVLSLLFEAPMHGYQIVRELERRDVSDWGGVSRPQVYYSLKKLSKQRLIKPAHDAAAAAGPERTVFTPAAGAHEALAAALDREAWVTQRPPPPFVTWLVLSVHASKAVIARGLKARRAFLEAQVAKERETLKGIRADRGPTVAIGESVVKHAIKQFELELKWLDELDAMR